MQHPIDQESDHRHIERQDQKSDQEHKFMLKLTVMYFERCMAEKFFFVFLVACVDYANA